MRRRCFSVLAFSTPTRSPALRRLFRRACWPATLALLVLYGCGPDRGMSPTDTAAVSATDEAAEQWAASTGVAEGLLPPSPSAPGPVAAASPDGGAPLVFVRLEGGTAGDHDAPVVDNLAEAVAAVSPGGTIQIFDGVYLTEDVIVDRPLTVEPAPDAAPVIRTEGLYAVGIFVSEVPSGTVTLRNLTFQHEAEETGAAATGASVLADGDHDRVVVEGSRFELDPDVGVGVTGVAAAGPPATPDGGVEVRRSTFRGGSSGIYAFDGGRLDVLDSDFADHWFSGLQYQVGGGGRMEGNTVTDCGFAGCIRAPSAGPVEIVENRITNDNARAVRFGIVALAHPFFPGFLPDALIDGNEILGSGGSDSDHAFDHEGIVVRSGRAVVRDNVVSDAHNGIMLDGAAGTIEGNEVDACIGCIIVDGDGAAALGNTVTIGAARGSENAIIVRRDADARGNLIEGVGGDRDPADPSTWPIGNAILVESTSTATVSENTIRGAWVGINVEGGNGHVSGLDNVVEGSNTALQVVDVASLQLHSSDFTGYSGIFIGDEDADLTCNWWGSTDGPDPAPDFPLSWVPWATSPVAGTSTTTCSGGTGVSSDGLVAHWTGDGTADDGSGNGHHGTLIDDAGFGPGVVGRAFHIPNTEKSAANGHTGSDWVGVLDDPAWDFGGGGFTVATWVSFESTFSDGPHQQPLIGHTEGPGELNKWILWLQSGALTFHTNTPESPGHNPLHHALDPDPGVWHHVAVTSTPDGSEWRLYVDGLAVQRVSDATAVPDADAPLTLGKAEETWLEGFLDEAVIYHRALDEVEVAGLYRTGTP